MGYDTRKLVWVMGYGRVMGYRYKITAYRLGKWEILWNIKEYGLYPVWVITESTVVGLPSSSGKCLQTLWSAENPDTRER